MPNAGWVGRGERAVPWQGAKVEEAMWWGPWNRCHSATGNHVRPTGTLYAPDARLDNVLKLNPLFLEMIIAETKWKLNEQQ